MEIFNEFCQIAEISKTSTKLEAAILFIWFNQYKNKRYDISVKEINQYFTEAHLPAYNPSNLKKDLSRSSKVTKGSSKDTFKLNRQTLDDLNAEFLPKLNTEISITEVANINITPYLTAVDIDNARQMSQLYIIMHCLENSVRNFVERVLENKFGTSWWDSAKNAETERKVNERKDKELKNKWLSPRGGASPLFYLDWGDLVKLIRKFENDFNPYINEIKFVQLRLEELEKVRNIIAHNGVLPSQDDFDRVILHFKDWCKQVTVS